MFKMRMRKLSKSGIMQNNQGFTLIEVLIAVVLTAIIVIGIVMGILTMTNVYVDMHKQEVAKDIAASDMDYIMSQQYQTSASNYNLPSSPAEYSNYTSIINLTRINATEQKIAISISFSNKVVYTLTNYRTNY